MAFLDRFKRKKAVLIHEEKDVGSKPVPEQYPEVRVQAPPAPAPQMRVVSRAKALKVIKRKKTAKKRRVMKKSSRAKPRKHKKSMKKHSVQSPKIGEGSTNKWMHKERTLLDAALRDLNKELSGLRSSRKKLEMKMTELSDNLGSTQNKEITLRTQISDLMKKETNLTKKKTLTKDKLVDIDQKIEKVRAIQADLKTV
ncbi:MAG: hypothetical protein Q7S55_00325 [Nanoarchaeota archaeon]|nr:hypothetical protein [Nanoarchaeota archaeon]